MQRAKTINGLSSKNLDDPNVYIDAKAIEDSIKIPEPYFPFKLYAWQRFVNACVYGVRYKDNDRLVWNQILILMGRGGGKMVMVVGIIFICCPNSSGLIIIISNG